MTKKRKTKLQKVTAEIKQQKNTSSSSQHQSTFIATTSFKVQNISGHHSNTVSFTDYHFVKQDLIKTSLITGAIILVEVMLFFFVKL